MSSKGKKAVDYVPIGGLMVRADKLCGDTIAEHMLDSAKRFNALRSDKLVLAGPTSSSSFDIEYTAACLKFAKLPGYLLLRAIMEAWDYDDIIRELHQ